MAFHITQGNPNPLTLAPGANASFTIEVFVDGLPVGPGETIRVKLPQGLTFPPGGQVRYMKIDEGINEQLMDVSRELDGSLVRFKAKAIGNQPAGFYSVNVQALPDAAAGPRTGPDGLVIGTTTAALNFHIGAQQPPRPVERRVHGTVDANRNIISGDGFVVKPGLTGVHRVVFTEAFVSPPTVLATLRKGGERGTLSVESVDTGMFDVRTATNGVWTSLGFSFMAVGLAAPNP
ncbi:hypothetical protein EKH77_26745 [Streptomyces luteoverticillatus]|uniref:Uncharacterized protein n=1 Tax=Streptomyces luteoverticillatus TaxID=66425 RepID=A0A3Q9G2V8_STRLT|nr:hypothetical protein [Streptomyces luteoverticillatus]AZQ74333.1 hypothetical protein EKH77_26745 [Streptomyces luteoverticillatus]